MHARGEKTQLSRWWPWMAATGAAVFLTLVTGCATGGGSSSPFPDRWPTADRWPVTSEFGPRMDPRTGSWRNHSGLDVAAPKGTPVLASAPGRVVYSGRDRGGYGKLVKVDHGNGVETWYAHLSRLSVRAGKRVDRGEKLGRVGSTGRASGPHLHYEVRQGGRAVDPRGFLDPRLAIAAAE
jgi:murein DD-endopeptidase MepM/ murein hydrolase activator NlpD